VVVKIGLGCGSVDLGIIFQKTKI